MFSIGNTQEIIFTASSIYSKYAWDEIQSIDTDAHILEWLDHNKSTGRVRLGTNWETLIESFRKSKPIFCRHICPVQSKVAIKKQVFDLNVLTYRSRPFISIVDSTLPFSIQTRLMGGNWPYKRYDVNTILSEEFVRQGAKLNVKKPKVVFSVVLTYTQGYLGLSYAEDNLSNWTGGMRRFKREAEQVSRAEFKLLEALEFFELDVPANAKALDLGSAPGGWTRILLTLNAKIVAVDPAKLAPSVILNRDVIHIHQKAQDFLSTSTDNFDIILNDMRMDAQRSSELMLKASERLRDSGWAILTLKLSNKENPTKTINNCLSLLSKSYFILGVKHLFHNRNEVTVALKRKKNSN